MKSGKKGIATMALRVEGINQAGIKKKIAVTSARVWKAKRMRKRLTYCKRNRGPTTRIGGET